MLAIVKSTALYGLEGRLVQVEVDVANGLPSFDLVGLPDTAVREARDRVRAALKNSGFDFPVKRITVNLAPADLKKEGPLYDLPIAAGILAATGQIDHLKLLPYVLMGELSLDGTLREISGTLPNVLVAREQNLTEIIVPAQNANEASLVQGVNIYPVTSLNQMDRFLRQENEIKPWQADIKKLMTAHHQEYPDMADIRGQDAARRALEVAAAGGHNILLIGSPGTGKTMLARRLPGILPDLSFEEAIEVTKIHSLAGLLRPNYPLVKARPFRDPHHTASTASLVGGGHFPRPGEISLAHLGVLFLDEMPEFRKDALESLRAPLEDGIVTISRVSTTVSYPAQIMMVGACNPCPCGYYGDSQRSCSCTPNQIQRYLSRISGPLLDRIDLHLEVPRVAYQELSTKEPGEPSAVIKKRVQAARRRQQERLGSKNTCNARLKPDEVRKYCHLTKEARALLAAAFRQLHLSARAHDRILKVALTIADLAKSEVIEAAHLAEAIQYRNLESKYYLS